MFEGFERRLVDVGDVTINCVVGGSGPALLLLHGFPQNLHMWARVAPLLANEYTVVCADLRGYGGSSKPVGAPDHANYSFRAMASDQRELMRTLGFERFHLVGHDRGGRTGHRMALDHPDSVLSLAVLDIIPTYVMFEEVDRFVARAYWHWYFLQQPAPYPEKVIGADPDTFYEGCLFGWGATGADGFDPEQLEEYRKQWRDPAAIHGSCCDYRAGGTIDFELDHGDLGRQVQCPALVFSGSAGLMHSLFEMQVVWAPRLANMRFASLPGGHFFVDRFPDDTARILREFLSDARSGIHQTERRES
uniref:Fluoroacetate dehalogenase n=1 Tax=Burkholderia sp. TaxID=36773 RepID=DEHA_BURSP|nr:RecName: Full=Fluoroacetate dehalogenase [Burkholderia sp.]1Y37_A Chain A, Fluoroacetate Dehalogenase [Burkholderia sp. FA1]1Y37_B Chain B, Fluoroacetate Dehalogenase [Burkholderia sp. FA1]BAE94252.1 fluoroacetate dehalogenase [Burkholderia sp. FA1]